MTEKLPARSGRPPAKRDRVGIKRDLVVLGHLKKSLLTYDKTATGAIVVQKIDELVEVIRLLNVA